MPPPDDAKPKPAATPAKEKPKEPPKPKAVAAAPAAPSATRSAGVPAAAPVPSGTRSAGVPAAVPAPSGTRSAGVPVTPAAPVPSGTRSAGVPVTPAAPAARPAGTPAAPALRPVGPVAPLAPDAKPSVGAKKTRISKRALTPLDDNALKLNMKPRARQTPVSASIMTRQGREMLVHEKGAFKKCMQQYRVVLTIGFLVTFFCLMALILIHWFLLVKKKKEHRDENE